MSKVKGNSLGTKFVLVVSGVRSKPINICVAKEFQVGPGKLAETEIAGSHRSLTLYEHVAIVKINMVPMLIIITKRSKENYVSSLDCFCYKLNIMSNN